MATEEYYNDFYKNKDWRGISIITKYKTKVFIKLSKSIFNKNIKSIIDAGCGKGLHSAILTFLGYKTFGFDFSETAIKQAKEKYNFIDFRVLNGANLSYKNKVDLFFAKGFSPFNTKDFKNSTAIIDHWHNFLTNNGLVCLITKSNFTEKLPTGWIYLSEININKLYNGNKFEKEIIYLFPPFWIIIYILPKSKLLIKFLSKISKNIFVKLLKIPVSVIILLKKNDS